MTQAAVSRQIHGLERELGFALFRRLHRRVELTERGQVLSGVLSHSFNLIDQTIANVRAQSDEDELVIGATIAFTQLWLLPRISEFRRLHPGTKIRLITQDTPVDLERDMVDVAIRYGDGVWPDGRSVFLCEDDLFPVCSPDYAAGCRLPVTADEFLDHTLLDYESPESRLDRLEGMARRLLKGAARPADAAPELLQRRDHAAVAGHGIALGWNCLVEDLLRQGRLRRVTELHVRTRSAYFVVVPSRAASKPNAQAFVDWLGSRLEGRAA